MNADLFVEAHKRITKKDKKDKKMSLGARREIQKLKAEVGKLKRKISKLESHNLILNDKLRSLNKIHTEILIHVQSFSKYVYTFCGGLSNHISSS